MKNLLNYIGQVRLYSLIDLILLLIAAKAGSYELMGAICLHVGFLALLENKHNHMGRKPIPNWLWIILTAVGATLYQHLEVTPFLACSYLYTKKNTGSWGLAAPAFRGLQHLFLIGGITGYNSALPWIALLALACRNFVGDWRDVEKDSKKMKTLPMIFGLRTLKYGHLMAITITSFIWWHYANLDINLLIAIWSLEIATYNLTPR